MKYIPLQNIWLPLENNTNSHKSDCLEVKIKKYIVSWGEGKEATDDDDDDRGECEKTVNRYAWAKSKFNIGYGFIDI